ncbi:hypothetical protein [Ornithinibacillus gellani]|nr:hypothetical protein [Ornithinibacillus gellani]
MRLLPQPMRVSVKFGEEILLDEIWEESARADSFFWMLFDWGSRELG